MNKTRILLMIFVPAILLLIIALPINYRLERKAQIDYTINQLEQGVDELSMSLSRSMRNTVQQVRLVSSLVSTSTKVRLREVMRKTLEELPNTTIIGIAYDPDFLKRVKAGECPESYLSSFDRDDDSIPDELPATYAPFIYRDAHNTIQFRDDAINHYETKDWFLATKHMRRGHWFSPYITKYSPSPLFSYAEPLYCNGQFAGVVYSFLRVNEVIDSSVRGFFDSFAIRDSRFFIVDENGRIIYHSLPELQNAFSVYSILREHGKTDLFPEADEVVRGLHGRVRTRTFMQTGTKRHDNFTWYLYSTPYTDTQWTVVGAFEEYYVVTTHLRHMLRYGSYVSMLLFGFCAIVALVLLRANRPLEAVVRTVRAVSLGDLEARVPAEYEKKSGDVGALVREFNQMVARLDEQMDQIRNDEMIKSSFDRELAISKDLQETFLPHNRMLMAPDRGYLIGGDLLPAKHVAGDFFDYWRINPEVVGLVVGDVSGKGIPAAMIMIAVCTLIRQLTHRNSTPSEVMTEMNRQLMRRNKNNMFATVFLAFYYPATGKLAYCNAGHNPPMIVSGTGNVREFDYAENTIIGVDIESRFETCEAQLDQGDVLIVFTDGVTDATSVSGEQFGKDRFKEYLAKNGKKPMTSFFPEFVNMLREYQGDSQTDDTTMLVLKLTLDVADAWTCRETLMTFFGKNEETIKRVVTAMKEKRWPQRECESVRDLLRNVFDYVNVCNGNEMCKAMSFACAVTEKRIDITVVNDGDGFHFPKTPDDPMSPEAIRAQKCLDFIAPRVTSCWFDDTGTILNIEKRL